MAAFCYAYLERTEGSLRGETSQSGSFICPLQTLDCIKEQEKLRVEDFQSSSAPKTNKKSQAQGTDQPASSSFH